LLRVPVEQGNAGKRYLRAVSAGLITSKRDIDTASSD
jgi:hypothetical protein